MGGSTTTYTYNGDGLRVGSTTGGVPTTLVYDVNAGLPVLLTDGTRKVVWGAQGLAYAEGPSGIEVFHTDGPGAVRVLADSTGGAVQTCGLDVWTGYLDMNGPGAGGAAVSRGDAGFGRPWRSLSLRARWRASGP